jgi:hypothetical protein
LAAFGKENARQRHSKERLSAAQALIDGVAAANHRLTSILQAAEMTVWT